MGLNGEKNSGLVVIKRYLGKFDHDRTLFSRTLESNGLFMGNHPHSWPQDSY